MGVFEKLAAGLKISYFGNEEFMWLENEEILEEHSNITPSNNPKDDFLTVYDVVKEKYIKSLKNTKTVEFRNSLLFVNGSEYFAMVSHRSSPTEIQTIASRMENYSRFFCIEILGKAWVFYEVKKDCKPRKTIRLFNNVSSPYFLVSWTFKILKIISEAKPVVENKKEEVVYDMMNPNHYISLTQTFTLETELKAAMLNFSSMYAIDNTTIKNFILSFCIEKFNKTVYEKNKFHVGAESLYIKESSKKIYIFTEDSQKDLFNLLKQKNKNDKQAVYYMNVNSQSMWVFGILNKDMFLKQSEMIQCSAIYTKECMGLDLICNMIQYMLMHASVNLK